MITAGQDAQGRWAWMLRDERGRLITSRDGYDTFEDAEREAMTALLAHDGMMRARRGGGSHR